MKMAGNVLRLGDGYEALALCGWSSLRQTAVISSCGLLKQEYKMERRTKSEWFRLDRPIGEPEIRWNNDPYDIERVVTSDGTTIWFGQATNWKKEKDGEWTKLTTNENAKPLEKYLPEIVYGEDRNIFVKCDIPIYEKLYLELGT